MKTWMKVIPLVAGLAFTAGALATPALADDDDRRRGDRIQRADHKSGGKHYDRKGKEPGYRHGRKSGYREGRRDSKYARKKGYKHGKHHSNRHYSRKHGGHRHKHHYGHRHRGPAYGHRPHYVPFPAFVFRYYHQSRYEAPAERYPHVQPQVIQAVATQVAEADSWPETCLMTREYQTEITVGGEVAEGYGQACLQPDGSWYRGPAVAVQ